MWNRVRWRRETRTLLVSARCAAVMVMMLTPTCFAGFGDELRRLVPDSPVSNQDFGDAIDISGNFVLVGAEDTAVGSTPTVGRAYLFDATTGQQLTTFSPTGPTIRRAFGSSVTIDDGLALIAAEDEANVTGAAYLFDLNGTQLHRLAAMDGAPGHEFGQAIGIYGNRAAVSAPGVNVFRGQIYLFDTVTGMQVGAPIVPTDPLAPGDEFGNAIGFDDGRIIAGIENGGLGGAAYIFDAFGNQLRKLEPPLDPVTNNPVRGFGRNVAISGNIALVGATPDESQVFPGEFGRAYLFNVETGEQLFELLPDDTTGEDLFGEDLDISGNLAIVSARREAALGMINQAYVFDVTTGQQISRLNVNSDIIPQDEALEGIAISGRFAVGGVESFDSPGFMNNGIAIVFDTDIGGPACDFNGDASCNISDIDALIAAIVGGGNPAAFDLNGDGLVNLLDRDAWLTLAGQTNIGAAYLVADANLNGTVDVADFDAWNTNRFTVTAAWSAGDFNADGVVDVSDFHLWNERKFEGSMATSSVAVPEPTTWPILGCGLFWMVRCALRATAEDVHSRDD